MKAKLLVLTLFSLVFAALFVKQLSLVETQAATDSGPVSISLTPPISSSVVNLTCILGDVNCRFQAVAIIANRLNVPIYDTTIYTSSQQNSLTYTYNGSPTSEQTVIPGRKEPGQEIVNTLIGMKPLQTVGKQYGYFYVDAKICNLNTTPPDCSYYGASSFAVVIDVVSASTPTPTPTPVPSVVPSPSPSVTPTPTPTPSATPNPSVSPTPTPTPTPPPISYYVLRGNVRLINWFRRVSSVVKVLAIRDGAVVAETKVNAKGDYQFNLPAGTYKIKPTIAGYQFIPTLRTVKLGKARIVKNINFLGIPIIKFKLW